MKVVIKGDKDMVHVAAEYHPMERQAAKTLYCVLLKHYTVSSSTLFTAFGILQLLGFTQS